MGFPVLCVDPVGTPFGRVFLAMLVSLISDFVNIVMPHETYAFELNLKARN